jgi:hypothetical protein
MAGRPPKEKSFANMLRIAVAAVGDTGEPKLRELAEKLVTQGLSGEGWAIKEIADRIDGKVAQAIVGDDEHDPISMVAEIRRTIVRPNPGA